MTQRWVITVLIYTLLFFFISNTVFLSGLTLTFKPLEKCNFKTFTIPQQRGELHLLIEILWYNATEQVDGHCGNIDFSTKVFLKLDPSHVITTVKVLLQYGDVLKVLHIRIKYYSASENYNVKSDKNVVLMSPDFL